MKKVIGFIVIIFIAASFIIYNCFIWKEHKIVLDANYNELFSNEDLYNSAHQEFLPELTTDVTIGYQNKDGTKTLCVYSSPINFQNGSGKYEMIDTRIANVKNKEIRNNDYYYTIANSDIKSFYPKYLSNKKGIYLENNIKIEFGIDENDKHYSQYGQYENFIGDIKNSILYDIDNNIDLYVYPTSTGSNCEFKYKNKPSSNTLTMWLKTYEDMNVQIEEGEYITFRKIIDNEEEIVALIQKPLIKSINGEISYNSAFSLEKSENNTYKLTIMMNEHFLEKETRVFTSFEIKRSNQPDNAIYSKKPELENAYLKNYSIIGNEEINGIGRLMIRFQFVKNFNITEDSLINATYSLYSLTNNYDEFELNSILEKWCSITGNWNENYKTGERVSYCKTSNNCLNFNITDVAKRWCNDPSGDLEYNGLMLKSIDEKNDIYNIILSNDNTLYKNKTVINFK